MSDSAFFLLRLNDHIQYLRRIEKTLEDKMDFCGCEHRDCKLGQWMFGEGAAEVNALDSEQADQMFAELHHYHERFHEAGQLALNCHREGNNKGAHAASTEMHCLSANICKILMGIDELASKKAAGKG